MVHVTNEQAKAQQMLIDSIAQSQASLRQSEAALAKLCETQQKSKTMLTNKRAKDAHRLYQNLNRALNASKEPITLDGDDIEEEKEKESQQSETSSKFEQPKSKLQDQIQSQSVVNKSHREKKREKKKEILQRLKKSKDDEYEHPRTSTAKRIQKKPISQPANDGNEEEKQDEEDEEASRQSLERVNDQTHAAQWNEITRLIKIVQQAIEPWTLLPGQTMLSKMSENLKDFPQGYLFPSAHVLNQFTHKFQQLIPPEANTAEVHRFLNPKEASSPKSPSYECESVSRSGSFDDKHDKQALPVSTTDQPTTRSESLASPPLQPTKNSSLITPQQ
jgi:hypothetical protein